MKGGGAGVNAATAFTGTRRTKSIESGAYARVYRCPGNDADEARDSESHCSEGASHHLISQKRICLELRRLDQPKSVPGRSECIPKARPNVATKPGTLLTVSSDPFHKSI